METRNTYPVEMRSNSISNDWSLIGATDTPEGARRLAAQWNREYGWQKYRAVT